MLGFDGVLIEGLGRSLLHGWRRLGTKDVYVG
jgi:hypothetical protein